MRKVLFTLILQILFIQCSVSQTCNNWLSLPSQPSYVNIGDLDIPGNALTIEATANRTSFLSNGTLTDGDLVSKHTGPADVNYLLRPTGASITTSNGFFTTPPVCGILLNKTYHYAMVYDGSFLKFYRNGFLMSQVAATGTLFQNNLNTQIGFVPTLALDENFIGYINEVRIWNTPRTQAQIQANMNSSLPSPTTQPGLLAYYTFNDLLNKQGNAAWNGTLNGSATIAATNPNCTFVIDSCGSVLATPISNIINDYTPVTAFDPCKNALTVDDATQFNPGDTVLLIQMKGAVIDNTNTASFGTVTDYKSAGNFEFNIVQSKNGNNIILKNVMIRAYDIPLGKVQLVRVPYYQSTTVTATLTCKPWDGSSGGIVVLTARDSVTLNANIDVSGNGFRGGQVVNNASNTIVCSTNNYFYPFNSINAAPKGESIVNISTALASGKGAAAGGGGGGLDHNSGGGGGGNGGTGGFGGYQYDGCPGTPPFDNRGIGGRTLSYTAAADKIFLGAGGGAGQCNQASGINLNGGNGGGMVLIQTPKLISNGNSIISNGVKAIECTNSNPNICNDGCGGGGAGGTVLLNVNAYTGSLPVVTNGGAGANLYSNLTQGKVGPGGGGGGGITWVSQATMPAAVLPTSAGGANGVILLDGNNAYGTTAGQPGTTAFNFSIPVTTTPFKINIDSVRFNFTGGNCSSNNVNFFGLAYINTSPITTWSWNFGDGGTDNTQNTSHVYSAAGTYTVKLIATDINGCKDSLLKSVVVTSTSSFDFSYKQDACNPLSVQFTGAGNSLTNPYWSFGDAATTTGTLSPTHTYAAPGNYLVRFTVANAPCNDTISKVITIDFAKADIVITPDTTICFGATKQLRAQPSANFCWTPTTYLNNANSPTPITSTPQNITYFYTSEVTGNNLITNGNFSNGNTGFTSAYVYAPNNTTEGEYFVGPNPTAWNGGAASCKDHTTTTGNMMLVNGAPIANTNVWRSAVTVTPNTNYAFSCWVQSISSANPAQLQFSINNILLGPVFSPTAATCNWLQFSSNWNSGNNTNAVISIVNLNTIAFGNDFALDDISFAPITIKRDSVKITVDTPKIVALGSTAICSGLSAQLNATGGSVYSWTPATGLSNANIANPVAAPAGTTTYTLTGTTVNGCSAQATATVTIQPRPVITKTKDSTICKNASVQLLAGGGTSYTWSPAATLNNPNIANPIATPTAAVTLYYVTVINNNVNTCSNRDSVKISIKPDPVFAISQAQATCQGKPAQLTASGGDIYLWSPAAMVSNAAIANPLTTAAATTNYNVTITESTCNVSKTLSTLITVNPNPVISATKSNDIDCSLDFSNLLATGATQYSWAPATGLSNSTVYNPVARPTTTTQYVVTGANTFGCTGTDIITVAVTTNGASGYYMPNTFTPNGDGKNDCFGIKLWGGVKQLEFSIYNRYGKRVFYTTDPNQCWDGLYKSTKPLPGSYVYYIKAVTTCGPVEKKGSVMLLR